MARSVTEIGIVIKGDGSSFTKTAKKTNSDLKSIDATAKQTKLGFVNLGSVATKAGALVAGAFSVREVMRMADEWTNYTNKLKLVTSTTTELVQTQKEVADVANDTRQSLTSTVELYQRLNQANDSLGLSQEQLIELTKTINQSLVVSGSSAASSEAAIIQLSQAFSSGVLRGDEFNSVVEQAPRLAKALADGLGIGISTLREMASQGELTADTVVKALSGQAATIEAEFNKTNATVEQGFQVFINGATSLIGKVNEATNISRNYSKGLEVIGEKLSEYGDLFQEAFNPTPQQRLLQLQQEQIANEKRIGEIKATHSNLYEGFLLGQQEEYVHLTSRQLELEEKIKKLKEQVATDEATSKKAKEDGAAKAEQIRKSQEDAAKLAEDEKKAAIAKIEAQKEHNAKLSIAKRYYEDNITYLEDYKRKLDEINALEAGGFFQDFGGKETADRARASAEEDKEKHLDEFLDSIIAQQKAAKDNAKTIEEIEAEKLETLLNQQTQYSEQQKKIIMDLAKFEKLDAEKRGRLALDALTEVTGAMAGKSKKAFEVNKKLRIAQAIIDGIGAVQAAYAHGAATGGPIGGALAAGAAAIFTASQVQAIRSQEFQGGGNVQQVSVSAPSPYQSSTAKTPTVTTPTGGSSSVADPPTNRSSPPIVNVYNTSTATVETRTRNTGGNNTIDFIIKDRVDNLLSTGQLDDALALNYGLQRSGRTR